ncbi:hypothetical protein IQ07DRAFT_678496 [Pyrenochaeta sp. DS3sAY3a]|nr:hypothetical protein IQ07DRAFT_678496 [Pyrenochaeta sp. DS3sAY3a]
MHFRSIYLCFILPFGLAHASRSSDSAYYSNLSFADYYTGPEFTPPPYLKPFVQHVNDLEIEYLEFFTQLRPVNKAPEVLSQCLYTNDKKVKARRSFLSRKLKGFFKHVEKQLFGEPPTKPIFQNYCAQTWLTINVYYHIVASDDANFKYVTMDMLRWQTLYLNRFFSNLDIQFIPQDVAYRVNNYSVSKIDAMHPHRRFTRSGTYADLNIWITEEIQGAKDGETYIGYGTYPDATLGPERTYDGVVIVYPTLPQHAEGDGSNLVHEVGHWLGLRHVFDEAQESNPACPNTDSDEVYDTPQFPAHRPEVFQDYQTPCGGQESVFQTNFMSYAGTKGQDGYGFTTGQKARAFAQYLGVRRGLKNQVGCITSAIHSKKRENKQRATDPADALPQDIIDAIREDDKTCAQDLAAIRARPDISLEASPDPNWPEYPVLPIEPSQRKASEPVDPLAPFQPGSSVYIERCLSTRLSLDINVFGHCSASGDTCLCPPPSTPGGADTPICPSPKPGEPEPEPKVEPKPIDTSGCPAVCNPHKNACDVHSAQNCVFPAPFATPDPRAYCACRPGYKSVYGTDASKHWRVATVGIENFVWVAEGVVCDEVCQDVGCSEVPVLSGCV